MAAEAAGAAIVSIGQTVTAYSFFLPPIREVRRAPQGDRQMRGDVRMGQLAAGAVTVAVGALLANLSGSRVPLWVAIIMGLVIAGLYETALRGEGIFE